MKNTIKEELTNHIIDMINDDILNDYNKDDWHFLCFNQNYYLIGYYQCSEWLKRHNLDVFEAIEICQQYEIDNFGEAAIYDNSEKTVNMLAYIYGEELIYNFAADNIEELKEELENS